MRLPLIFLDLLILNQLISLGFQTLNLFLHVFDLLFELAQVGGVAVLKLRNNVFEAFDGALHLLLEFVELLFEACSDRSRHRPPDWYLILEV